MVLESAQQALTTAKQTIMGEAKVTLNAIQQLHSASVAVRLFDRPFAVSDDRPIGRSPAQVADCLGSARLT